VFVCLFLCFLSSSTHQATTNNNLLVLPLPEKPKEASRSGAIFFEIQRSARDLWIFLFDFSPSSLMFWCCLRCNWRPWGIEEEYHTTVFLDSLANMEALAAYASESSDDDTSSDQQRRQRHPVEEGGSSRTTNSKKRLRTTQEDELVQETPLILPPPPTTAAATDKAASSMIVWSTDYLSAKQETAKKQLSCNPKLLEIAQQRPFRSYADRLREQHDFYNPHDAAITVAPATSEGLLTSPHHFQEWETIDELVIREEKARIAAAANLG